MRVRSLGRRGFITVLGAAALWPFAGHAQQSERVRRVGVLLPWPEKDPVAQASVKAFARALNAFGWVEGKNIQIDYRFGAGDPTLYKTFAAELVGLAPDAILADVLPAVAAVQEQTRTIPIVFLFVPDPVGLGLVESLARPGGNITGFSSYDAELMGKWLQLLKEIAPGVTRVSVIFNPDTAPFAPLFYHAIEGAAPSFGMTVTLAPVHDNAGIEEAVAPLAREPGGGLICLPDSFNTTHRDVIIAAAARSSLPLIGTIEFHLTLLATGDRGFESISPQRRVRTNSAQHRRTLASIWAKAMKEAEIEAEIEDFLEGFNQPTYRGMRINGVRVATCRASTAGVGCKSPLHDRWPRRFFPGGSLRWLISPWSTNECIKLGVLVTYIGRGRDHPQ